MSQSGQAHGLFPPCSGCGAGEQAEESSDFFCAGGCHDCILTLCQQLIYSTVPGLCQEAFCKIYRIFNPCRRISPWMGGMRRIRCSSSAFKRRVQPFADKKSFLPGIVMSRQEVFPHGGFFRFQQCGPRRAYRGDPDASSFFALYSSPQLCIASRIGFKLRPRSVRVYSTRGGTSG